MGNANPPAVSRAGALGALRRLRPVVRALPPERRFGALGVAVGVGVRVAAGVGGGGAAGATSAGSRRLWAAATRRSARAGRPAAAVVSTPRSPIVPRLTKPRPASPPSG